MKGILKAGSVTGLVIIIGEGMLNGMLLKTEWALVNEQLNLSEPSDLILGLVMLKLFILGYVVVWLYDAISYKYGQGLKTALFAGAVIGLTIWGWVLAGMWMAGYVNNTIAVITFFWGMIELPLAAAVGYKLFSHNETINDKLKESSSGVISP
jgi:hypothetical protein